MLWSHTPTRGSVAGSTGTCTVSPCLSSHCALQTSSSPLQMLDLHLALKNTKGRVHLDTLAVAGTIHIYAAIAKGAPFPGSFRFRR